MPLQRSSMDTDSGRTDSETLELYDLHSMLDNLRDDPGWQLGAGAGRSRRLGSPLPELPLGPANVDTRPPTRTPDNNNTTSCTTSRVSIGVVSVSPSKMLVFSRKAWHAGTALQLSRDKCLSNAHRWQNPGRENRHSPRRTRCAVSRGATGEKRCSSRTKDGPCFLCVVDWAAACSGVSKHPARR
ncbi:hypothetical protein OH77DRAFT_1156776 [Trametes cingulata]|nr:hypothetical protein OH77DRAFT_1156776 [Trametes cingulata]